MTVLVADEAYQQFCAGTLSDPYPFLARLRDEDPVHWSEALGAWLITRYDDVFALHQDARASHDRIRGLMASLSEPTRVAARPLEEHIGNWLPFTDPPRHTRLRRILAATFTPRLAQRLTDRMESITEELVDRQPVGRPFDIVNDFAYELPTTIIFELMGMPASMRTEFDSLIHEIGPFLESAGPTLEPAAIRASSATVELQRLFRDLAQERLREPREDLISELAALEATGEISAVELMSLCVFVFAAGHQTSWSLISNTLLLLLSHPDQMARLREDPALLEPAIEEALRFEAPLQIATRIAAEDFEVRGRRIAQGDIMILGTAAANRDPLEFPEADRFDIARSPNRHLSFGWRTHFCLGAPLARAEARVATRAVLTAFPAIRIDQDRLEWVSGMITRRVRGLQVRA